MRIVVLGLSLSSSWGNGHATTWRALLKGLAARGHDILFLERDTPWYAANRDLVRPSFCVLRFYADLAELEAYAGAIAGADLVLVGSYVPQGVAVGDFLQRTARGVTAFYDIDTPVTLAKLARGDDEYLSAAQIPGYHVYFSFTGGPTLTRLERVWGARRALALYCCVDTLLCRPTGAARRWTLGYLGTYSPDRQPMLERLLIEPARRRPHLRFIVAGPQFPSDIIWPENIEKIDHLPPADHAGFYSSLEWTLNITRADMRVAGFSPSVRLFEAAACACPIISDPWPGLDETLRIGPELRVSENTEDVLGLLALDASERTAVGCAARARVLAEHTGLRRAAELEAGVTALASPRRVVPAAG